MTRATTLRCDLRHAHASVSRLVWRFTIYGIFAATMAVLSGAGAVSSFEKDQLMSKDTWEFHFQMAAEKRGLTYAEAKAQVLALAGSDRRHASRSLKEISLAAAPWERVLTAKILLGWMENSAVFAQCAMFARGDVPNEDRPLGGFSVQDRAIAIASLGPEVTPRLIEMVYKLPEFGDANQEAAVFAALSRLKDVTALEPMIVLVEDVAAPLSAKLGALSVLAQLGDARGLKTVSVAATNPLAAPGFRETAIRCLAGFAAPEAAMTLVTIMTNSALPLSDRQAAANALNTLGSPATLASIRKAISEPNDPYILVCLIPVLGRIGTAEDVPLLLRLTQPAGTEIAGAAEDAIREILLRK